MHSVVPSSQASQCRVDPARFMQQMQAWQDHSELETAEPTAKVLLGIYIPKFFNFAKLNKNDINLQHSIVFLFIS